MGWYIAAFTSSSMIKKPKKSGKVFLVFICFFVCVYVVMFAFSFFFCQNSFNDKQYVAFEAVSFVSIY